MNIKPKKYFVAVLTIICILACTNASGIQQGYEKAFGISTKVKIIHGFQLKESKPVTETGSTAMLFYHVKSGANLIYLKNDDMERSFGIGFRTPAVDNTGVNHILEHSVLNGSKNYPVKSPFLQMEKQSLKTYLNALTFPDFTLYPVASKNEKDFQNLMKVYLDAVFFPNIYREPNIFKQEGWRYELDSKDSPLKVNGIVYNEMKGQYSSPKVILDKAINKSLFPDASYKWSSGGDPEEILKLTNEKLLETHKKFYCPSNSLIFLYGRLDLENILKLIDEEYLSKLGKQEKKVEMELQKPFKKIREEYAQYPVSRDSDDKNKTYMALNFAVGNSKDKDLSVSMSFLANLLLGSQSSPLKKALLDSKICENISYSYSNYSMQPVFSIILENTEEGKKEEFKKIVNDVLGKIVDEGFDSKLVKALFNYYELEYKSSKIDSSRGIGLNISAMQGWMYGEDPLIYLNVEDTFKKLQKGVGNKYFENTIRKCLLENKHSSIVILKPVKGLDEEKSELLKAKLQDYKAGQDEEGLDRLVRQTKEFKLWQETPDKKEDMDKLPKLSIEDIDAGDEETYTSVDDIDGVKVVFNRASTGDIASMGFYFDASKVPQEKLQYLSLLTQLLGKVSTVKYGCEDLSKEILANTGGMELGIKAYTNRNDPDIYYPKVILTVSCLEDNQAKALEIAEEIINNSVFDDKEKLRQTLEKSKAEMEAGFLASPNKVIGGSLSANLTESGKYNNQISGLTYYRFICDILENIDEKCNEVNRQLNDVRQIVFNRENLVAGYTGEEKGFEKFKNSIRIIIGKAGSRNTDLQRYSFASPSMKESFILPVNTLDVMKGGNFKKAGYNYSGKMKVLQKILNDEYLWQNIRVKGGAYGGNVSISEDGKIIFLSYRDPNLKETLETFDNVVQYLRSFDATKEEMEKYIIGAVGESQRNFSPILMGSYNIAKYLSGITQEDIQKENREILSTTAQDIRDYADMMDAVLKQGIYYAAGNETIIRNNKDIFSQCTPVLRNDENIDKH